jgi:hypothetical protein
MKHLINPCEDCIAWPICKQKVLNLILTQPLNLFPVGIVHTTLYRDCSIFCNLSCSFSDVSEKIKMTEKVISYARGFKDTPMR